MYKKGGYFLPPLLTFFNRYGILQAEHLSLKEKSYLKKETITILNLTRIR
jgi:hypothetical protein